MPTGNDEHRSPAQAGETVLPLLAEEVAVSKQVVETAVFRSRESPMSESS